MFTFNLDVIREQKWEQIKKERDAFEFGTFEYNGFVCDCDAISASRIMGAMLANVDVVWKTADNQLVTLTATQVKELYSAMVLNTQEAHERGRVAKGKIDAANTITKINNVKF